jgi:sarcosine oxidase, subunit beta
VKPTRSDVTVVGAGIIGLFCAYFLARRGLKVVVLERKTPGSGSSTRNGGGVRSQWGTATNIGLSLLSEPYWAEFEERFGVDIGLRRIGYMFLAPDPDGLHELERQVALQHRLGVGSEILTTAEIATRWPTLRELDVAGASFCASDGFVNQHRVVHAMTRAVEAAGVTIECGVDVTRVDIKAGRTADLRTTAGKITTTFVLNCAGAWAPSLTQQLDVTLPIRSRRVQLLLARPTRPLPADLPWLIDLAKQVHLRQDLDGQVQVGGFLGTDETVDPAAFNHDADETWESAVLRGVAERFGTEIDRSSVSSWAGLYPSTPDQHPIIDRTDAGMIIVGGFAGAGLMHAPAAGLLAAELVLDGRITSLDPAPVSLARFSTAIEPIERTGF